MSDLITKARKKWCDPYVVNPLCAKDAHYKTCPPDVVSALLDVLEKLNEFDVRMSHGGREALRALAAIAKALEEK